ncbi:MAG: hypothetical protein AAFQ79_13160 [Pseudomonadota bacterium]
MDIQDLIGSDVRRRGTAAPVGQCVDVVIDTATGEVPYLLLDITGENGPIQVMVRPEAVILSDQSIVLDVEADTMDAALKKSAPAEAQPVDLTALPPLLVGPFGNTIAPAMFGAVYNATAGRNRTARPTIDARHASWHWFEDLQDRPVFDETGQIGTLITISVDKALLRCTDLTVKTERDGDLTLSFDTLRNVSRTEHHLVLQRTDPPPHSIERLKQDLNG